MITILKNNEARLETLTDFTTGAWVHVVDPTPDEISTLQARLGVPADFITYPLDVDERPRTEKEDGATLILLRMPYFHGQAADVPYATLPVGIILTDGLIATVCRSENGVMHDLMGGRVRNLSTAKRNRFVLHLLLLTAQKYLSYLREINRTVDGLEDQLQASMRNKEVLDLLKYQKSLTYFTTALKSNELMMHRLQRSRLFELYPEDDDLLEDALTETQQAIEMTAISSNILSNMTDAFASIISNNLNVVMKFLASVTIVLSIPTIVASFYGMNVDLPMQDHSLAFAVALGLAVGLMGMVVIVFRKKNWF